jgi:hypothetical protein
MLVSKQQWTKHGLVLIQGHLMSKQRHDVHASSAAPKLFPRSQCLDLMLNICDSGNPVQA